MCIIKDVANNGTYKFQLKPYFDIEAKIELDKLFDETIKNDIENDIKIYNVEIYIVKENQENKYDGKMKHSYRLCLEARISYYNIPVLFKIYLINMILLINRFVIEIEFVYSFE